MKNFEGLLLTGLLLMTTANICEAGNHYICTTEGTVLKY